ncbi:MAG: C10 family peptidase [Prevotella sp.]|nr:C10 family peptidase [Prevotella sp.]
MKLKHFAALLSVFVCFFSCNNEDISTQSPSVDNSNNRIAKMALAFAKSINGESTRAINKEMSVKGVYELPTSKYPNTRAISQETSFYTVPMNDNMGTVLVATDGKAICPLAYFMKENSLDVNTILEDTLSDAAFIVQSLIAKMDDKNHDMSHMIDKEDESAGPEIKIVERLQPKCKVSWHQYSPYNNDCPIINGKHALAGCVAIAGAQALTVLRPNIDYITSWDEIVKDDFYRSYAATKEISNLVHQLGVDVNMSYGPNGSGAETASLSNVFAKYGIKDYNAEHAVDVLKTKHGVIVVSGRRSKHGWGPTKHYVDGHSFLADGYVKYNTVRNTYYFHLNYGWGESYKDVYVLSNEKNWNVEEASKAYGAVYEHKVLYFAYTYETEKNWN